MARQHIILPLYGPRELAYAKHPLIVPHLGVRVTEPAELEWPIERVQGEPVDLDLDPDLEPGEPEPGVVHYFYESNVQGVVPTYIHFEAERFSPINHEGVIFVIEAASFVPRETFDIAQARAESLDITVLPIYVRGTT
jgi:hypothetical protein